MEKLKIAKLDAKALETRRLHGGNGERQNFRLRGLRIGCGEPFDAGLAEFAWSGAVLGEAEGRTAIAIARLAVGPGGMGQVIAAGRHREIGPEAHLVPLGIGEDIGIGADVLARAFEEDVGRLQNVGRDVIEARFLEHAHDARILRFERLALRRGLTGH